MAWFLGCGRPHSDVKWSNFRSSQHQKAEEGWISIFAFSNILLVRTEEKTAKFSTSPTIKSVRRRPEVPAQRNSAPGCFVPGVEKGGKGVWVGRKLI